MTRAFLDLHVPGRPLLMANAWDRGSALADDHSLMASFSVISIAEPEERQTRSIIRSVVGRLERQHRTRIEPEAIDRTIELTRRFLTNQAFPGKAIRLLEEVLRRRPANMRQLVEVRGIGRPFCEKHGESMLAAVRELDERGAPIR